MSWEWRNVPRSEIYIKVLHSEQPHFYIALSEAPDHNCHPWCQAQGRCIGPLVAGHACRSRHGSCSTPALVRSAYRLHIVRPVRHECSQSDQVSSASCPHRGRSWSCCGCTEVMYPLNALLLAAAISCLRLCSSNFKHLHLNASPTRSWCWTEIIQSWKWSRCTQTWYDRNVHGIEMFKGATRLFCRPQRFCWLRRWLRRMGC